MFSSAVPHLADVLLQTAGDVVSFESVARPLAIAAGLAVAVERVLELLKNATDLVPPRASGLRGHKSQRLSEPIDRLEAFRRREAEREAAERERSDVVDKVEVAAATADAADAREIRKLLREPPAGARDQEVDEAFPPGTLLVQDATDADDGKALRALTLQLVAAALGIIAARLFGVRLFDALTPGAFPAGPSVDFLLTGLLIGGGSGPVHMLIRFVGERKVTLPEEPARDEEVTVVVRPVTQAERTLLPAPEPRSWAPGGGVVEPASGETGGHPVIAPGDPAVVVVAPDTAWVDVPYRGGVDREILESVHRRRRKPDTIIYHHTAMHRSSSFEDVVRVIKDRRDARGNPWITGYNCVVTGDGAVHPFCRWDRYGNHAAGWNARSLGIALNGNFETDPRVPYANPDGRYGPARPSAEQLEAAARVVALWTLIYGIPLDFDHRIIPHSQVSPKTCPGNAFPRGRFQELVTRFHHAWANGPDRVHVDAFDRLPYLHDTQKA